MAPELMQLYITQARWTPERPWLSGPGNVVLQQSVRDLEQALRNGWVSLRGSRKGGKVNPPRFKRCRGAQSIHLTSQCMPALKKGRFYSGGKISPVPVKWSRPLPLAPSSATLVKDASGCSFTSFVVGVEPTPLPGNDGAIAIAIDRDLPSLARCLRWRKVCPRQSFCPLR